MKKKGTKNITYTQRLIIEKLLKQKKSVPSIAKICGLGVSSVYAEINRGKYWHYNADYFYVCDYSADKAQQRYKLACTSRGRKLKIGNDFEFVNYMQKRVCEDKISACAVLGQIKHLGLAFKTNICKSTLYNYIRKGDILPRIKLEKRKPKYKKVVAKRAPRGTSIEQRPKEIYSRQEFGHWEGDCVCGSTKSALFVLTERQTRFEIIFKIENKYAKNIVECINQLERKHKGRFSQIFKTITFDNGSEFSDFEGLEKSVRYIDKKRTLVFYCHPYSSSERGTNERINKDIRRHIPKGASITKVTHQKVRFVQDWLNDYPRAVLGYATPAEKFAEQLVLI